MAVFPVGSTVTVTNAEHGSVFSLGDTLTIVSRQDGEGRWDTVRASRGSLEGAIYVGSLASTVPTGPVVGGRVKIRTAEANGASVSAGDLGTIVEVEDASSYGAPAFYVKMDIEQGTRACYRDKSGADYIFHAEHVEFLPAGEAPAEVTLDSFRLSFLTGAVARGERNGGRHPQQVKEALDEFARAEFLDPSKTLEQFQKRVVDHAMSAKGRYSWCGEPEAYLTEIGLAHLLPVKRTVRVTIDVEVTGEDTWRPSQWRIAARTAAAAQTDEGMFSATIL